MKSICWMLAAAAILSVLPAHAQDRASRSKQSTAGPPSITSPIMLIYRVPGVSDDGSGDFVGNATSFHCTNLSDVAETLVIIVHKFDGTIASNLSFTVPSANTFTASTHNTSIFNEDSIMSSGTVINQGYAAIGASTTEFVCSAMIVDASASNPIGISLHMLRYNASTGTQE
jgi:hypothetical protein